MENDYFSIVKNILIRRMTILIGLVVVSLLNILYFVVTFIIKGNNMIFMILDGLVCLTITAYTVYFIVKAKNAMFRTTYKLGRVIMLLPALFFLIFMIYSSIAMRVINYELLAYFLIAFGLEVLIFRFNIKDKNRFKTSYLKLIIGVIALALVAPAVYLCYKVGLEFSIGDLSRSIKYEVVDGNLSISGVYTGLSSTLNIKDSYYNMKVTAISENAFKDEAFLKVVRVPNNVTLIGANAFEGVDDVYLDGSHQLTKNSMKGVKVVHITNKDAVVTAEDGFFDGQYIDVDRSLIDMYRKDATFKKYDVHPEIGADEVYVNFQTDSEYISTLIIKKGAKLTYDALKNSTDNNQRIYHLSKEYQNDNDYYKSIYLANDDVLPYWVDNNGTRIEFDKAINKSLDIKPVFEKIKKYTVEYHLGTNKDVDYYVSDSRTVDLPTIAEKPRLGFNHLSYTADSKLITRVDNTITNSKITANWELNPSIINGVTNITSNELSTTYVKDQSYNLDPTTTHALEVTNTYEWYKDDVLVNQTESMDVGFVKDSGKYLLGVTSKYSEFGVNYESYAEYAFDVAIARATPVITTEELPEVTYDMIEHPIKQAAISVGEPTPIEITYKKSSGAEVESPKDADTYTATLTIAQTANYNTLTINKTIIINKKDVEIVINSFGSTYGNDLDSTYLSTNDNDKATITGFITGDTKLGITLSGLTQRNSRYNAGTYEISGTIENNNYNPIFTKGSYVVTKRDVAITFTESTENLTYGDQPDYEATDNFVEIDKTGFSLALFNNNEKKDKVGGYYPAGDYYIDIITNDTIKENYNNPSVGTHTISIAKKALEIKAEEKNIIYGDQVPTYTVTYEGFVTGEGTSNLSGDIAYTCAYEQYSNVGEYDILPKGVTSNNYEITFKLNTLKVSKASLNISADNKNVTYGDNAPEYTVTYTGFKGTDSKTDLSGTLLIESTYAQYSNAGSYDIVASGNDSVNYEITYTKGTLSVAKAQLSITADNFDITYGDNAPAYTVTYTGFLGSDTKADLSGTLEVESVYQKYSNAGSYEIIASGNTSVNYSITYVKGTLSVAKAALTITAEAKNITYGDSAPAYTVIYTGFLGTDSKTNLSGTLAFDCDYLQYSNTGSYDITPKGNTSINYIITYVKNTLTVAKKNLTLTANAKSIKYGDNVTLTYTAEGLAREADRSVLNPQTTTDYVRYNNIGEYDIIMSYTASDNYNVTAVDSTITVEKRTLTVKADNKSITYGEKAPKYTATYTNLAREEDKASLGALQYTCSYKQFDPSDAYTITPSGLSNANYDITFSNGILTVNKKSLTVKADDKQVTYGDDKPTYTVTYNGFVGTDDESVLTGELSITCTYAQYSNAGSYNINVSGLSSSNYNISYTKGILTVGKADLTVTADNIDVDYGDNALYQVSYSGFVGSDTKANLTGTLSYTTSYNVHSNVGNYEYTPKGLLSNNYNITFVKGTITVNPVGLTIAADDKIITYGDQKPNFTVSGVGFKNNDTLSSLSGTLAYACSYNQYDNVGTYDITPSGVTSTNYNITFTKGTLTVEQKELKIKADDKNVTYGDNTPEFTATYTGFVGADDESVLTGTLSFACSRNNNSSVGSYDITPSGLLGTNYNITYQKGTLTVTKATLTITSEDKTITYGDELPEFTVTYSGFKNDQDEDYLSIQLDVYVLYHQYVNAGNFYIYVDVISGALNNYTVKIVKGRLTVNKRALTVTADDKHVIMGSPAPTYTYTATGFVGNDTTEDLEGTAAYTCSYNETSPLGTYDINVSGLSSPNYEITFVKGKLTVTLD